MYKENQKKTINGITTIKDKEEKAVVCYINKFTDGLKDEIRSMFCGIYHGKLAAEENKEIYNYKNTIKIFLERYKNKNDSIKKGMIAELLVHLLITVYIPKLEAVSVYKNKEERSIKKGFDIVYFNKNKLWYCEVKSGGDCDNGDVNTYNGNLLNNAKNQLKKSTNSVRNELWDSVLIDLNSTIFQSEKRETIKQLLHKDHPNAEVRNSDRNVLVTSVLYKPLTSKITLEKLCDQKDLINNENIFNELIIFSIQKETYQKIENFLIDEISEHEKDNAKTTTT
jgi:hypothetical protein